MQHAQLRDYREVAKEPVVPVRSVIFTRTLNGIGDTLNGLVTAYWISQYLNASFSVCWPEAKGVIAMRVPALSHNCTAWKAEWERQTRRTLQNNIK